MVQAIPTTYTTKASRSPAPPVLATEQVDELRFFFSSYESLVGIRSTYSSMLAAANGLSGDGASVDRLEACEALVDDLWRHRRKEREGRGKEDDAICNRASRVRGALKQMRGGHVVALYRMYGPAQPLDAAVRAAIGELAPLADLTNVAEETREELALKAGEVRSEAVVRQMIEEQAEKREGYEALFWQAATRVSKIETALSLREEKDNITTELETKIQQWRDVMSKAISATLYDGRLAAQLSTLASADREITVSFAISHRLRPVNPKLPKDVLRALLHDRAQFIMSIRRAAAGVLREASTAYLKARGLLPEKKT